jgi:enterochelin esterase-like enzyme
MKKLMLTLFLIAPFTLIYSQDTIKVPENYTTLQTEINASANGDIQNELKGLQFRAFVNRVNALPSNEKQTIVDSFMNATSSFPFIEENTIVYYIYQGAATRVNVPGDANFWATVANPMTKLDGTNFWYNESVYESDARLGYKFYLDGNLWILDPLNPNQVPGGDGPNSELAMPDYVQPPEVKYYPNISHGTIDTFSFRSKVLGNTRTIKVYKPFNYESQGSDHFPLLLLHDGIAYLDIASADNILDYLIDSRKIIPIICVFVPPVDRVNEYALNETQQFESFIVDELMPHIDSIYRTVKEPNKRAMGGVSNGGLITTQICYNHPENFGLSALFSPSYQPKNMEVFNLVSGGPQEEFGIRWYIDWGTYEWSIMQDAVLMRDVLIGNGYDLVWNEWHEAHSWGNWRAHLDNALEYFFPDETVDVRDELSGLPLYFSLTQNYPNPFNPSTKISWQMPVGNRATLKVFNILGKEIATLVNEYKPAGKYETNFNAEVLPSGVYFYQLIAGDYISIKKMILLK